MVVGDRYRRGEGYTIELSTEKCSEVSKKCRIQKCRKDDIDVFGAIFLTRVCLDDEYQEKSKYRSRKRKKIVLRNEKESKKLKDIPID